MPVPRCLLLFQIFWKRSKQQSLACQSMHIRPWFYQQSGARIFIAREKDRI
jgi:hypothetical protein